MEQQYASDGLKNTDLDSQGFILQLEYTHFNYLIFKYIQLPSSRTLPDNWTET